MFEHSNANEMKDMARKTEFWCLKLRSSQWWMQTSRIHPADEQVHLHHSSQLPWCLIPSQLTEVVRLVVVESVAKQQI